MESEKESVQSESESDDRSEKPKPDKIYKMILIGNSGVGKTSLIQKALKNEFSPNIQSTIGFQYSNIIATVDDKKILLQTWDICGQDVFHSLINSFYKRSNLTILVYAIDDRESFESLEFWLGEIRTYSRKSNKIVLVGNKKDLDTKRTVSYEEGKEFFESNKLDLFYEASAKEGTNAAEIFTESVEMLYDFDMKKRKKELDEDEEEKNSFYLHEVNDKDNTGKSCEECY